TYITGYDERPWPDVYFTTTLKDKLLAAGGCLSTSNTDANIAPQIVLALWLTALSVAIPQLLPLLAFTLVIDFDAALNQPPDSGNQGGAGCRLLQALPTEIPLPQTGGIAPPLAGAVAVRMRLPDAAINPQRKKLVLNYAGPTVNE